MKEAWLHRVKNLVLLILSVVVFLVAGAYVVFGQDVKLGQSQQDDQVEDVYQRTDPQTIDVHLKRTYLDGKTSVEVVEETIWSMPDFWATYESWQLVDQNEDKVVFHKRLNDISPFVKANGYFGLSKKGELMIYEGHPEEHEAVQSFFQIDVEKLESRLENELKKGIPVSSTQNYRRVLNELKPFQKVTH